MDSGPVPSTCLGQQGQDFRATEIGGRTNCPPRSESSPSTGEKGKTCSLQTNPLVDWCLVFLPCSLFTPKTRLCSLFAHWKGGQTPDSSWGREGRVGNLCQAETQCRKPFGVRGEKDGQNRMIFAFQYVGPLPAPNTASPQAGPVGRAQAEADPGFGESQSVGHVCSFLGHDPEKGQAC